MAGVPLPDTLAGPLRVAPGSERRVLVPLALALPASVVLPPLGAVLLALAAASLFFYRDPDRAPAGAGVLSPADGHVSVIREDGDRVRVGVFMSPLDVHVLRAPADGTVARLDHRGAAHRPAFAKDSERNERVEYTLRADTADRAAGGDLPDETGDGRSGERLDGALIAGWFARRITPYVSTGDALSRGQRIGYIAFGSRADVVLPASYDPEDVRVAVGEAVRAGESILARRE